MREDARFIALTAKRANPGWPDGSPVCVKPHSRIVCEHKSSLENIIWLTQHLVWIFVVKELQILGWFRLNMSWSWWVGTRWGTNTYKLIMEIRDVLLRILYFVFPNSLGIPSGEESGRFSPLQNISFGKYWKILNWSVIYWAFERKQIPFVIIAQAQPFISFISKLLSKAQCGSLKARDTRKG